MKLIKNNNMTNETLVELGRFAERKYLERLNNYENCDFSNGVIEGAKWQAERMYSEEEVIAIVEKSRETGLTAKYLLLTEQFKKDKL
jgi:hypothetical protein